jgi:hypothetical protein
MDATRARRNFIGTNLACLMIAVIGSRSMRAQELSPLGSDLASDIQALKPDQFIWTPEIAPSGPVLAVISLAVQRCYVYRNGVLIGVTTVSTGRPGRETPTGVFTVLQKQVRHKSNLYDSAPMPYMERLTWSGVAMHAGNLPGYPTSHGCIHMPMTFAKLLYGMTTRGMTVVITDLDEVPRLAPTPDLLQGEAATKAEDAGGAIWEPQKAVSGPVSLILSGADKRLVVLRNGVLIGSTPVSVSGPVVETTAHSLSDVDEQGFHWMQLPLPGQRLEGRQELPVTERAKMKIPAEFRSALDEILTPGATLVVTADSLLASGTGKSVTVIEAGP